MEEEFITLNFGEKLKVRCRILGTFECENKEYIALLPDDETGELFFYKANKKENGEIDLIDIKDEEEMRKVVEAFQNIFITD